MNSTNCEHTQRPAHGRGLCHPCYDDAKWHGKLEDYPLSRVRAIACDVEGCDKAPRSGCYCRMHSARLERYGSLELPQRPTKEQRFWAQVDKSGACWEWRGRKSVWGYGRFTSPIGNLAHRYAYTLTVGPIPEGLTLDHLCENTGCVNPAHLEPVTRSENAKRQHYRGVDQQVTA